MLSNPIYKFIVKQPICLKGAMIIISIWDDCMEKDLKCQILLVTNSIDELANLLKALVEFKVKTQYQVMFSIPNYDSAENLYKGIETAYNIGEGIKHITKIEKDQKWHQDLLDKTKAECETLITKRNNLNQEIINLINEKNDVIGDNHESITED
jgi:Uri superfamily endonuclease